MLGTTDAIDGILQWKNYDIITMNLQVIYKKDAYKLLYECSWIELYGHGPGMHSKLSVLSQEHEVQDADYGEHWKDSSFVQGSGQSHLSWGKTFK